MMKKFLLLTGFVLIFAWSGLATEEYIPRAQIVNPGQNNTLPPAQEIRQEKFVDGVPVLFEYHHKIVYTTSRFDEKKLKADCDKRGGTFRECGSVCDESMGLVTCIAVCAYTCEFEKVQQTEKSDEDD